MTEPDRVLPFERCFNFRDLGGYSGLDGRRVRWRRLFRSMTPQYMSEADAVAVAALNISLVIDLRGDRFSSSGPVVAGDCIRLPLSPEFIERTDAEYEQFRQTPPEEALPRLLETYAAQYGQALVAMAERQAGGVLFHCRLGKDRTGVFTALLLKLLGVKDDDVIADYMLTEEHEPDCRGLLDEVEVDETIAAREPVVAKEPPSRRAIENVLQRLTDVYGGAYAYFTQQGVTASHLDAFIADMLEPSSTGASATAAEDVAGEGVGAQA